MSYIELIKLSDQYRRTKDNRVALKYFFQVFNANNILESQHHATLLLGTDTANRIALNTAIKDDSKRAGDVIEKHRKLYYKVYLSKLAWTDWIKSLIGCMY